MRLSRLEPWRVGKGVEAADSAERPLAISLVSLKVRYSKDTHEPKISQSADIGLRIIANLLTCVSLSD